MKIIKSVLIAGIALASLAGHAAELGRVISSTPNIDSNSMVSSYTVVYVYAGVRHMTTMLNNPGNTILLETTVRPVEYAPPVVTYQVAPVPVSRPVIVYEAAPYYPPVTYYPPEPLYVPQYRSQYVYVDPIPLLLLPLLLLGGRDHHRGYGGR